jgi:hypothetical protein
VKSIAIALSCLPFFQGFSPAAAAAAAAHMTCATVMANHVVTLQVHRRCRCLLTLSHPSDLRQGEAEYLLPNGER